MPALELLTRREMLGRAALALAGATLGFRCPPALAARAVSPIRFIVATDLHYRDARCGRWLRKAVAQMGALQPRPEFCVLAGDLSEDGDPSQLAAVREIFEPLPMPVHVALGNHDYDAQERRNAFQQTFRQPLNYRFSFRGYEFLVLDTTAGRGVYRTRITGETLRWLEAALARIPRERPLVVFTHFPLGRNWLRPVNARDALEMLQPHRLEAVFSGHWHGLTSQRRRGAELITGRCCSWWRGNHDGSSARGFLLGTAGAHGVQHEFVAVA